MDDPQNILRYLAEMERQKKLAQEKEQIVEIVTKIMAATYEKAAAYTNLIIVAGYAAFFAIWSYTKIFMTHKEMIYAALCITISCLLFVIWEIVKMLIFANTSKKLKLIYTAPPDKIKSELEKQVKSEEMVHIKLYKPWIIVLSVTVAFGFGGAGILIYSFIRQIIAV